MYIVTEAEEPPDSPPYKNVVKFYSDAGVLIYTVTVPCNHVRRVSFLISCVKGF